MHSADVIEQRIKAATKGMPKACFDKLLRLGNGNGVIIADYLLAYKIESAVQDSTRDTVCDNLELFIRKVDKPFSSVTRQDILLFLSNLKKPEDKNKRRKWIGTYNLFSTHIRQFFKWFYYPDVGPKRRQTPAIVDDLPKPGKPGRTYRPIDMWMPNQQLVFLKYCPNPKIKCYHAIATFTGARPHEILGLKIGDLKWLPNGEGVIFEVTGKTGSRTLKIMVPFFMDFVKRWIDQHPRNKVPSSYLIYSKKTDGKLAPSSLWSSSLNS